MADTTALHQAEAWVTRSFLSHHFKGRQFGKRKLSLKWGGEFEFDAVSQEGDIVAAVSTSSARTRTGRLAAAKYMKLKADALYLTNLSKPARLVMVFTERNMLEHFEREQSRKRFPPEIEFLHAELPPDIAALVSVARNIASLETSPSGAATQA